MKITLAKGGTAEKTVELKDIKVPDLWEIAHLSGLDGYSLGGKPAKAQILECWHLCHAVLNKLRDIDQFGAELPQWIRDKLDEQD